MAKKEFKDFAIKRWDDTRFAGNWYAIDQRGVTVGRICLNKGQFICFNTPDMPWSWDIRECEPFATLEEAKQYIVSELTYCNNNPV